VAVQTSAESFRNGGRMSKKQREEANTREGLFLKCWKGKERVGRGSAARAGLLYITAFIRRSVIVICWRVDSCPTRARPAPPLQSAPWGTCV
jgi:hypothetical protein